MRNGLKELVRLVAPAAIAVGALAVYNERPGAEQSRQAEQVAEDEEAVEEAAHTEDVRKEAESERRKLKDEMMDLRLKLNESQRRLASRPATPPPPPAPKLAPITADMVRNQALGMREQWLRRAQNDIRRVYEKQQRALEGP
jgi:hypothetical protein